MTDTAEKDARRLDPCNGDNCYKGATVYGPHHSPICPRYRGNVKHNCPDCGAAIHYAPHAPWCPWACVIPPGSSAR